MPFYSKIRRALGIKDGVIRRDIEDFNGSILYLGGTQEELVRLQSLDSLPSNPANDIYTVNIRKDAKADLIADMGSEHQLQCLPDKRFDLVVFSGIPTGNINMKIALKNALRLVKDDGLVLFHGGVGDPDFRHPITGGNDYINIPRMMIDNGFGQTRILGAEGRLVLAAKDHAIKMNSRLSDLTEATPAVTLILQDNGILPLKTVPHTGPFNQNNQQSVEEKNAGQSAQSNAPSSAASSSTSELKRSCSSNSDASETELSILHKPVFTSTTSKADNINAPDKENADAEVCKQYTADSSRPSFHCR